MDYMDHEVVRLTKQMVDIESTNVGTFEKEIGLFVADWLDREVGLPVIIDEFEPGRFNVISILEGEIKDPAYVNINHMDVVPAGSGWKTEPFNAVIEGNRMYGRGTADMKGGLAAGMLAFRDIVKSGRKPKRDYVFIATADEEGNAMTGAMQALKNGYVTKNSYVLDHEPSLEDIFSAHKGKTWFKITAKGVPAHGSMPWTGADAIIAMSEIICNINNKIAEFPEDDYFGRCSVCFGTIKGGNNTNIVAEHCEVTLDMRLAPPLTTEGSLKLVEDAIAAATAKVAGTSATYEVIAKRPYVKLDESSKLFQELKAVVKAETGHDCSSPVFTGYTDSGVVAAETGNIECMSYGPIGSDYHKANEWLDLDSLLRVQKVSKRIAERMIFEI